MCEGCLESVSASLSVGSGPPTMQCVLHSLAAAVVLALKNTMIAEREQMVELD